MRRKLTTDIAKQYPLYILGGGSIGLLYASKMRIENSSIPTCLLLQSHHKSKVISSLNCSSDMFPFVLKDENGMNHPLISDVSSMFRKREYLSDRRNSDAFIIAAFKNVNEEITLLDIPAKIINDIEVDSNLRGCDCIRNILLCTKAPDAVHAIESILHLTHPKDRIKIIVMTNGSLAVVSDLKKMLKSNGDEISNRIDIILASTSHGAHRGIQHIDKDLDEISMVMNNQTFNIHHAGLGHTYVEDTGDVLGQIVSNIWNQIGLNSNLVSVKDMHILNWKKLATNCAINPLTALRGCRNGHLLLEVNKINGMESVQMLGRQHEWDHIDPIMFYQLIKELSDVAIADAKSKGMLDQDIHESFDYNKLVQFVEDVVKNTANNHSSMLQDVMHKRYPTEIDYLNGYIVNLGRQLGVDTFANEFICNEVENLTKPFES